jgi:hypothetical protein
VWRKFTDVSEVHAAPSSGLTLMMEAASTTETSANFYQSAWHNNPEDSLLHTHRRENLKTSHTSPKSLKVALFATVYKR